MLRERITKSKTQFGLHKQDVLVICTQSNRSYMTNNELQIQTGYLIVRNLTSLCQADWYTYLKFHAGKLKFEYIHINLA